MSQSGQALFLSSEELDRLSSSVLLNMLCLLWNEERFFTSFVCLFVLCMVQKVGRTNGRRENLTFDVCTLEGTAEFRLVGLFLWFFLSHRRSSTGEVSLLARSHAACVSHRLCQCVLTTVELLYCVL